jgi:tetratricopeptide (TPR) repeat protein
MKSVYCVFALFVAMVAGAQQAPAPSVSDPSTSAPPAAAKPAVPAPTRKVDRAAAYYHYTLAHLYEEQVAMYGRSELVTKAIEEYRQAIEADPTSEYLTSALAELYTRAGRIRDAVLEAQDILKRDPNNLEAHKLLGRIYLKSLGDVQAGTASDSVLKLAIEQWEQIVKLEPDSVDDRLLLGRLYKVNNDLRKAEDQFKTAVKLQPDSEDAVTTLALSIPKKGTRLAPPRC